MNHKMILDLFPKLAWIGTIWMWSYLTILLDKRRGPNMWERLYSLFAEGTFLEYLKIHLSILFPNQPDMLWAFVNNGLWELTQICFIPMPTCSIGNTSVQSSGFHWGGVLNFCCVFISFPMEPLDWWCTSAVASVTCGNAVPSSCPLPWQKF
jgi:hypothetical protein